MSGHLASATEPVEQCEIFGHVADCPRNPHSCQTVFPHGQIAAIPHNGAMRVTDELRGLREAAGLSVRALAQAIDVPPSTYAQYESSDRFKKKFIPVELASKIARALTPRGIPRADVMRLAGLDIQDGQQIIAGAEVLTVKSAVAAGVWREQAEWPREDWYPLAVGPSPFAGAERFAVRMEGYSMDRTIPPGSDLECLSVIFGTVEPEPGDLVIVARQVHDLLETTCKRLDRDGDDWILRMESTKPEFQDIIRLGQPSADLYSDAETRVIGIVLKAHQQHFKRR